MDVNTSFSATWRSSHQDNYVPRGTCMVLRVDFWPWLALRRSPLLGVTGAEAHPHEVVGPKLGFNDAR